MLELTPDVDAVVIGGGFYGTAIAVYLAKQRGVKNVLLVEREGKLLARASYNNQARVHNGYHYPRSFTTAYRSRINLPKFLADWPSIINGDFTKLYAIARRNSKVTAKQFERFCRDIGADFRPAKAQFRSLFEPRLVEDIFEVEEYAFDSTKLASWAKSQLAKYSVNVKLSTRVTSIGKKTDGVLCVRTLDGEGIQAEVSAKYIFNCTYSGLNQIKGDFPGIRCGLKHEVTEMALVKLSGVLSEVGITVMDGPFFSVMPFPSRSLHTLSHVRYTPHFNWEDKVGSDPYLRLHEYEKATRVDRMVRDVTRYIPSFKSATFVDSLFEVKTVLMKSEVDDGRPILFEKHADMPGCFSILGGKIDNIYDVLEKLDSEQFDVSDACSLRGVKI
jgi:glycine/D-amino acid oxidase-like deaminating enzyme